MIVFVEEILCVTQNMTVHTLHVDSRDRDAVPGASPASYVVRLPERLKKVVSARLLSAEIPSSFYVFRAEYGNTSLHVSVNGVDQVLTIPDGNYTASSMATTLRAALNEAYAPWTFQVALSKTTLKLSFQSLDGLTMSVDTRDASASSREWGLGYYLGFDKDAVLTGQTITAPRVASTNPYTYLVLDCEELNGAMEGGIDGAAMAPHGCFAKIPFSANSFEYVFLDASSQSSHPITYRPPIATLDRLRVRWRFHDGRLVNFQDLEHSFTLELVTKDPAPNLTEKRDPVVSHAAEAATKAASAADRVAQALSKKPLQPPPAPLPPPKPPNKRLRLVLCGAVLALLVAWLVTRNAANKM